MIVTAFPLGPFGTSGFWSPSDAMVRTDCYAAFLAALSGGSGLGTLGNYALASIDVNVLPYSQEDNSPTCIGGLLPAWRTQAGNVPFPVIGATLGAMSGGIVSTFAVPTGDYLTGVRGWIASFMDDVLPSVAVTGLQFQTAYGGWNPTIFGASSQPGPISGLPAITCFQFQAELPASHHIIGLFGATPSDDGLFSLDGDGYAPVGNLGIYAAPLPTP